MKRKFNLGCTIGCLGLVLLCCLLPYLISSVYTVVGAILQVPTGPTWLWGEWVNQVAGQNDFLYMVLTEGPICGVGVVALLFVALGVVLAIGSSGRQDVEYEEAPIEPPYAP